MSNFPDPEKMTSDERMAAIYAYRAKEQSGNELSLEETRHALLLLRSDRADKQKNAGRRARTPSGPPPSLDQF